MTNTINVSRELLADLLGNDHDKRIMAERHLLAMLANAPSLVGVDGLDIDRNAVFKVCSESGCDWGSFYLGWKARGEVEQAIIDVLQEKIERLQFSLEVAKTDELSAAVYAETESIKHSLWDAEKERDHLASVLREWRAMFDGGFASGPLADLRIKTDAALIGLKK